MNQLGLWKGRSIMKSVLIMPAKLMLAVASLLGLAISSASADGPYGYRHVPFPYRYAPALPIQSVPKRPTLTPQQQRERIYQQDLKWSQSALPANETASGTALNTLLTDVQNLQIHGVKGPEISIDQSMLPSLNVVVAGRSGNIGLLKQGPIHWPAALSGTDFMPERQEIEASIPKAIDEAVKAKPVNLDELNDALTTMHSQLASRIVQMPPQTYIEANRLLDQLDDAAKLLGQPDAGKYFDQTYAAHGQTVSELVQYMTQHGLQFAPAVEGQEPAYGAVHQALAEYDVAANAEAACNPSLGPITHVLSPVYPIVIDGAHHAR
jgi:hypothetical protein